MAGRNLIEVSQAQFEKLLRIQCTQEETAAVLGVSINTLKSWCRRTYGKSFSEVADQFRAFGRASLRRLLYKHAEKNPAVCIFLAKNELGMRDVPLETDPQTLRLANEGTSMAKAIENASAAMKKQEIKNEELADVPDFSQDVDYYVVEEGDTN